MKRSLFWIVLLISLALACCAFAADRVEGDWEYEVRNYEAWIRRYNPQDDPPEVLIVPETLGGYPVRRIHGNAFLSLRHLPDGKSEEMPSPRVLVLPDKIMKVEPSGISFDGLEEIRIENGAYYQTVDGVLFEKETGTLVAYPRGKKDRTYRVPEFVQAIGTEAFNSSNYLEEVVVTDNVRSIAREAFWTFRLRIVFPEHISSIESGAAFWADEFVSDSPRFRVVNGLLIDTEEKELLCVPYQSADGRSRTITVPEGVETIGKYAFRYVSCNELILPSTLKVIEASNVVSDIYSGTLVFPDGLESIGDDFSPHHLKELVFPASLKSIGKSCFRNNGDLESVVFREGIVSIGNGSFRENSALKTVVLPQTLESIAGISYSSQKRTAFAECPELQARVLPDSAAEEYCRDMNIPYRYTFEGTWQVDSRVAAEVLSLPGAERVLIRLDVDTLELSWILDGSESRETYRIEWKDGRLCMDGGYMDYYMDGSLLTLELNGAELHLTGAEESQ